MEMLIWTHAFDAVPKTLIVTLNEVKGLSLRRFLGRAGGRPYKFRLSKGCLLLVPS